MAANSVREAVCFRKEDGVRYELSRTKEIEECAVVRHRIAPWGQSFALARQRAERTLCALKSFFLPVPTRRSVHPASRSPADKNGSFPWLVYRGGVRSCAAIAVQRSTRSKLAKPRRARSLPASDDSPGCI